MIQYKRALVTGGAGFIGSNVVKGLLDYGIGVMIVDNLSTGTRENLRGMDVEFHEGDIRNRSDVDRAVEGCDVIFHLAAAVGNVRSIDNPALDAETNVIGTLNVLEAARLANVRKIVYSSSAAIFGQAVELPMAEDHPRVPEAPYGASKLAGETLCLTYSRLYGLEAMCLRYFNVYGPNQRFDAYGNVIPIFVERLLESKPLVVYGDGEQTRDFVHAADVARANLLAARMPGSGTFNIGSGETVSVNRLVGLLGQISNRPIEVDYQPPRRGEVPHLCADIRKSINVLHYSPTVDFAQGLRDYVAWFQGASTGVFA